MLMNKLAILTACAALTSTTSAQTTVPLNKCWEKASSGGSESWSARVLSIGNQGSEVFTCTGPLIDYTRIYSSFDTSPPQEMMHESSSAETQRHRVDSATNSDAHVSLYDVRAPGVIGNLRDLVVKKYSASSLDWTYNFPVQTNAHQNTFVAISSDGETILAAAQNIFNSFSFDIAFLASNYSSGTANTTPVHYSPMGLFKSFALSADGGTFLIAGTSGIQVGSTATKAITHTASIPWLDSYRSDVVISGSGRFIAYATETQVRIMERAANTYVLRTTYDIPGGACYESHLDFSENDALLACGMNYSPDTHQIRVAAFDMLAAAGPTLYYSEVHTGGGEYDDKISDVSASGTGKRFAVGTWGDDQDLIPEVLVYSKNQSQPIATVNLPGSVWDLEMSPDGKNFAVGYKHLHANVFSGTTTSYSLYEVGKRDFRMSGAPRIGNNLDISLFLRPGTIGKLVYGAEDPNYTPADYLGLGTSYVNPASWSILNLGTGDADNWARRSISTSSSNFSQLSGQTLHLQGLALGRRKLSRDWVKVTLVP